MLQVSDEYGTDSRLGADRAFWVHRVSTHLVRVLGEGTAYRICLRQVPRPVADLRTGVVGIEEEAVRQLVLLGTGAVRGAEWRRARELVMEGLCTGRGPVQQEDPQLLVPPGGAAAEVARAIVSDPSDPRNLSDWAADLHISVKTLQRDFDRVFGMPFTVWRTQARLAAARDLLKVAPVGEVARRVGYTSTSAFVAAFARAFGRTPGSLG